MKIKLKLPFKIKLPARQPRVKMYDARHSMAYHLRIQMETDRRSLYQYKWHEWVKPKDFSKYLAKGWKFVPPEYERNGEDLSNVLFLGSITK